MVKNRIWKITTKETNNDLFTSGDWRTFIFFQTSRTARRSAKLVVVLVIFGFLNFGANLLLMISSVREVKLAEVDDHDQSLAIDKMFRNQNLRRRQIENDVPDGATRCSRRHDVAF